MKIDFEALRIAQVSEATKTWMTEHGGSHKTLLDAWSLDRESPFSSDLPTVLECLAYEIQKDRPRLEVSKRLLGKARKIRSIMETKELVTLISSNEDFLL